MTWNRWRIGTAAIVAGVLVFLGVAVVTAAGRDEPDYVSTYTPPRQTSAQPTVVILGDSFTEAAGDGESQTQFPTLLARKLCWSVVANGQSGTGYEAEGRSDLNEGTYGSRVDSVLEVDPDIVLVQGSASDPGGQSTAAAAEDVLSRLRAELPNAELIAVGPASPPGVAVDRAIADRDAVRAAAEAVGVPFLDALTWLDPAIPSLWSPDNLHPTVEGHSLFATSLANAIEDLGTVPTSCST